MSDKKSDKSGSSPKIVKEKTVRQIRQEVQNKSPARRVGVKASTQKLISARKDRSVQRKEVPTRKERSAQKKAESPISIDTSPKKKQKKNDSPYQEPKKIQQSAPKNGKAVIDKEKISSPKSKSRTLKAAKSTDAIQVDAEGSAKSDQVPKGKKTQSKALLSPKKNENTRIQRSKSPVPQRTKRSISPVSLTKKIDKSKTLKPLDQTDNQEKSADDLRQTS